VCLPSDLFPSGQSAKILYPFLMSPRVTVLHHLFLLDLVTLIVVTEEKHVIVTSGRDNSEDLGVGGRIILEWILRK